MERAGIAVLSAPGCDPILAGSMRAVSAVTWANALSATIVSTDDRSDCRWLGATSFGHQPCVASGDLAGERWNRVAMRLPLVYAPLFVIQGIRAGVAGRPLGDAFAVGVALLLWWASRRAAHRVRVAAQSEAQEPPRPYDERLLVATPPTLVRMTFRMGYSVPRPWRPWAEARIEQRYAQRFESGATSGFAGVTPSGWRRAALMAQGINPDDPKAAPLTHEGHPSRWSDTVLYWFPVWLITGAVLVVVATTVITLRFA
jgi:hypothetical protein